MPQSVAIPALSRVRTAIVMMNLGGPATLDQVEPFLGRLFADREIIQLPMQSILSKFITRRRTPAVRKLYSEIGGGSPIKKWTTIQGEGMVKRLDRLSPHSAPHKFYIAFRYAEPLTETALDQVINDRVERVVAFTQYPQYSCTTTGSSLNELYRQIKRRNGILSSLNLSTIDRWYTHPKLVETIANRVNEALAKIPESSRRDAVLLFSAHSIPIKVVDRGDTYPQEVAATVQAVMSCLNFSHSYRLVWQSKVGPLPWLGMSTGNAIKGLGAAGRAAIVIVPIAFTQDHIETLSEIDIEYAHLAQNVGIKYFIRSESLNDSPEFLDTLASIVADHLKDGTQSVGGVSHSGRCTRQLELRCPECTNDYCRDMRVMFGV